MRLASFTYENTSSFGIVRDDFAILDLGAALADRGIRTLRQFIAAGCPNGRDIEASAPLRPADKITYLPLIPDAELIICVGLNYANHIAEMGREMPSYPALFSRTYRSQVGHEQPIVRPKVSKALDYEGELAFVIGRGGRHISAADALDHIAGFTCYNDGSVRDYQRHTAQFLPGKNFRGTGAFGPWMVPVSEWATIRSGRLVTRLNGEIMQDTRLDDLIFDVPALVEYVSSFTDLSPGDVVITGTPGGVGVARKPPLFMKPGDRVEVEISGIGTLSNPIADEAPGQ